jgi:hypothetical protein
MLPEYSQKFYWRQSGSYSGAFRADDTLDAKLKLVGRFLMEDYSNKVIGVVTSVEIENTTNPEYKIITITADIINANTTSDINTTLFNLLHEAKEIEIIKEEIIYAEA